MRRGLLDRANLGKRWKQGLGDVRETQTAGRRFELMDSGGKGGRCPTPLSLLSASCHWAVLIHLAELPNLSASLLNIHR